MNNEPDYDNLYFEEKKMKKQTQPQPFFVSMAHELQRLFEKARCEAYFDGQRDGMQSIRDTLQNTRKEYEFSIDDLINICIPESIKATEENRQKALKEYEKREAIN